MAWLDIFTEAYETIQAAGAAFTKRRILNFASGASVADNPTTGATDVTISGKEPLRFNVPGLMVNGSTVYIGNGVSNNSSVKSSRPIGVAATYTTIRVKLLTAPSVGHNTVFTVMKNDAATGIAVTISDAAVSAVATVTGVAFAAGDTISIRALPDASIDNVTTAPDIVVT